MIRDVLLAAASLTAGALLVAAARGALDTARQLGIGPFTPYRRDGWPHGVQEEDAPAFRWVAAHPSADGPVRGAADPAVVEPDEPDEPSELVVAPSRITAATRSHHPGGR